ncbi:MAG: glycosyltransferase family 9 protein [Chloroflexaceae bacterium]|nr:glycosyltransferase family 9 protein [Chloroflexaceae bacterium]
MTAAALQLHSIQRVVLVRALPGLGDMLCAVPTLRAVRAALPNATVSLVGMPGAQVLLERFPHYLDELLEFPGFPGLEFDPRPEQFVSFLEAACTPRFDLAIQMHGSGIYSNIFTVLLGATYTAGCYLPGQYCPDNKFFLPYPTHAPEIWRWLHLLEVLGIPPQGDDLEFPLNDADRQACAALPAAALLTPGTYICVHAGASAVGRRWPLKSFIAVTRQLARYGMYVVLTGSAAEYEDAAAIAHATGNHVLNLAGQTSLGSLAVLLRHARLLICNDTGISHLAAALRVPSVVLFTVSEPGRWAPLDQQRHRVVVAAAPHEPLTMYRRAIEQEAVLGHVDDLLAQKDTYVAA